MKTFSQFLQEAYFSEAQVTQSGEPSTGQAPVTYGRTAPGGRFRSPKEQEEYERTSRREAEKELRRLRRGPTGAAARRDRQFKSPSSSVPEITATNDIASTTTKPTVEPSTTSSGTYRNPTLSPTSRVQNVGSPVPPPPAAIPPSESGNPNIASRRPGESTEQLAARRQAATRQRMAAPSSSALTIRSRTSTPTPTSAPSPTSAPTPTANVSRSRRALDAMRTQWNTPTPKLGLPGKVLGTAGTVYDAASEYLSQKERGRSTGSATAISAAKVGGGLAGGAAGAKAGAALGAGVGALFGGIGAAPGAAIGGALGGLTGYLTGSELSGGAAENIAGATGKEKTAMAQANRQRQAGGALKGIGGKTTFSQAKPGGPAFMSTGVGSQRRTVQLAKTSLVRGPGGRDQVGYLAFKGGKAVYKRSADPSTLARTSSNWAERFGRTYFSGAYKEHDKKMAAQKLAVARQADIARNKKLGVK